MNSPELTRRWIRVGIVAGLVACVTYPLMVFVPMPRIPSLAVAASFGPALAYASVGLHRILALHRDSVAAQAAAIGNVVAGALVTCMLIVQLQVRWHAEDAGADGEAVEAMVDQVWQVVLGLDVAFDVFVGLATLLFGVAMLGNPVFGRIVGGLGIVVGGVGILALNALAFPRLPVEAGFPDPGPISGLWYLLVVGMAIRSRRRLEAAATGAAATGPGAGGTAPA